jgi:hypothetical protein
MAIQQLLLTARFMPNKLNKTRNKFVFAKMLYPAITVFFIVVAIFLFSKTVIFLTEKINRVFSENSASLQEQVPGLDFVNYELLKERFNWSDHPTTTPEESSSTSTPEDQVPAATTTNIN